MGETDKEEFGQHFDEILDLAINALSQQTEDAISRRAAHDPKTCNKQIASKLENAELARDSEETCNNKQVLSKLVASDDAISRQASIEKIHWLGLDNDTAIKCDLAICALPSVNPQEPCEDWYGVKMAESEGAE
jgi:hypothetical protein